MDEYDDDFEEDELHGTFLIDESGKLRWQDISYEPFMEPEFLLKEAQRLLEIPATQSTPAATGCLPCKRLHKSSSCSLE